MKKYVIYNPGNNSFISESGVYTNIVEKALWFDSHDCIRKDDQYHIDLAWDYIKEHNLTGCTVIPIYLTV
jgi:hypothetical protein